MARRREAATRIALGAGPGRLARLYLTETLFLAGLGGLAGLVLAQVGIRAFRYFLGGTLPLFGDLTLDLRAVAVALAATCFSGLVMGFGPAWLALREDPFAGLRQSSTTGNQLGILRPRNLLVVGQVALSMVLLVGASLLASSFLKMTSVPLGFEPARVLAVKTSFPLGHRRRPGPGI